MHGGYLDVQFSSRVSTQRLLNRHSRGVCWRCPRLVGRSAVILSWSSSELAWNLKLKETGLDMVEVV